MKSERARAYLDQRVKDETVTYASALEAVRIVEEEAEDALQALREKFAADIHNLVDRWDESDKKIDRLWIEERDELKRDIERYKRDLAEMKERLRIAEKVIVDKNRQPRK